MRGSHPNGWFEESSTICYNLFMNRAVPAILLVFASLFPVRGEEVRYTTIKALAETYGRFLPRRERFAVTGQVISVFNHENRKHGTIRVIGLTDGTNNISAGDRSDASACRHGDIVTVAGFRSLTLFDKQLAQAEVRVDGHANVENEAPKTVSFRSLFSSPLGNRQVNHDWHGHLVRIKGEVASTPREMRGSGIMRLRNGRRGDQVLCQGQWCGLRP